MPGGRSRRIKAILIVLMIGGITFLHYYVGLSEYRYHVFFRSLYFLPVVLSGFWFGLRGALATSLTISIAYVPLTVWNWQGFSAADLSRITEVMLYNGLAVLLGVLRNREWREQRRSRQAERLAAMGKAVSSVAHDMKIPLIAIGGFSRLVQKHIHQDHPDRQKLGIVIEETRRLENLVEEMLDFSRPLVLHLSKCEIDHLIRDSLAIAGSTSREQGVELRFRPSSNGLVVAMDSMRMKQVIINLVVNGIQASHEGDTVTVSSYKKGAKLFVDVIDCGCGIPWDKKDDVFSPFFTTKKKAPAWGFLSSKRSWKLIMVPWKYWTILTGGLPSELLCPLTRIFHESLAATADLAVLPGVLGCRPLQRTFRVRLETNTLWLPGGRPSSWSRDSNS